MSFGYSAAGENNIMPITVFGAQNEFLGYHNVASNIVDLLIEDLTANETNILAGNPVELPLRTVYLPEFVDTEAPVISDMAPAGITYERKPEISAKITDESEVKSQKSEVRREVGANNYSPVLVELIGGFDTATGLVHYRPVNDLDYGKYNVKITAWDTTGNEGMKSFGFEVREWVDDTTNPVVEIFSPAEGSYVRDTVEVSGKITDQNLEKYSAEVETILETTGAFDSSTAIHYSLNTIHYPDGTYVVRVTAFDKANNSTSADITLNIDNTLPEVWFESLPSSITIGETFEIRGTVYDRNVRSWKSEVRSQESGEWNIINEGTQSLYKNALGVWNTDVLAPGMYTIKLSAEDKAGNKFEVTADINLESKPIVKINLPADRAFVKGNVEIKGSMVHSAGSIEQELWKLDVKEISTGIETVLDTGAVTVTGTDTVTVNWDTKNHADGNYEIQLSVGANNYSPVQITVDNTLPQAEITSPADGAWQSNRVFGIIDILGTADDENLANYKVEVRSQESEVRSELPTFSPRPILNGKLGELDTRNFTAGNYVLRINAKDSAGNETIIDKTLNLQPDFSVSAEGIKITNMDGLEIPADKISSGIKLLVDADIFNNGWKEGSNVLVV